MGTAQTTTGSGIWRKTIAAVSPSAAGVVSGPVGRLLGAFEGVYSKGQSAPAVAGSEVLFLAKHVLLCWIPGPDSPAVSLAPEALGSPLQQPVPVESPSPLPSPALLPGKLVQAQGVGQHRPHK